MGRRIPAGTGRPEYKRMAIDVELPEEEEEPAEEEAAVEPDSETQVAPA